MRLPRITTRRLMVLVAVAALPLVLFTELRRRQNSHARLANIHEKRRSDYADKATWSRAYNTRYHDKAKQAREYALVASAVASAKPKKITFNGVEVRWGENAEAHANDARDFEAR